jgi:hypothetical protein
MAWSMLTRCSSIRRTDKAYLGEMIKRQEGEGVKGLLIMCDREGNLGDSDDAKRAENRAKSPQVAGRRSDPGLPQHPRECSQRSQAACYEEQMKLAADGLHQPRVWRQINAISLSSWKTTVAFPPTVSG